jgi:glycosyltransferase involved in cell wall biosynthesis
MALPVRWGAFSSDDFAHEFVPRSQLAARMRRLPPPAALLVPGWTRPATWLASAQAWPRRVPVILPSDRTLNEPARAQPWRSSLALIHTLKNRLFQGFFTTGWLGVQALMSFGVPRERIATGLYPIDVRWWQAAADTHASLTAELRGGFGSDAQVVIAVAKMSPRENPLQFIEAFAKLHARNEAARLLFVGDGPMRPEVESLIERRGVRPYVHLAGYVPYVKLAAYYRAADVFVHAPAMEPWGISVGEAMALGLPVVTTTTVGSSADLVIPGRTGALATPGDADDLAARLDAVLRMRGPALREAVLERVARIDVGSAAQELERLVERIREPVSWEPLLKTLRASIQNSWGLWSQSHP